MKIKTLLTSIIIFALFTTGYAQTLDKTKLDLLFDRLAEKNKGMGTLVITKDGNVTYTRSIGYGRISETGKKTFDRNKQVPDRFGH